MQVEQAPPQPAYEKLRQVPRIDHENKPRNGTSSTTSVPRLDPLVPRYSLDVLSLHLLYTAMERMPCCTNEAITAMISTNAPLLHQLHVEYFCTEIVHLPPLPSWPASLLPFLRGAFATKTHTDGALEP